MTFTKHPIIYDKWSTVNFFFAKPAHDDFSTKAKEDLAEEETRQETADKYHKNHHDMSVTSSDKLHQVAEKIEQPRKLHAF